MSVRPLAVRPKWLGATRGVAVGASLALAMAALTACEDDVIGATSGDPGSSETSASPTPEPQPLRVRANVAKIADAVPVDEVVKVRATHGKLTDVVVTSAQGELTGTLSDDGSRWVASGRLEPGLDYSIASRGRSTSGKQMTRKATFHTADLTLDQQTYASVAPLQGETVGVGMPVIVTFDIPVTDQASMERHMSVSATPQQVGAWHWLNDTEVHWRPKTYWKPGSQVSVDLDINSVDAGAGIYGQEDRHIDFAIGDANVYKVNARTHQMQVFQNGTLLRTIPITTGKPGFITRSGVKVIIEKFRKKRMNSETVGISQDDPEYYNIAKVEYAMRVTYSGEFLHAAPWSVGSQGNANVSHGCTGMSTANAAFVYNMTQRGDVVEYTGTDRPMTLTNGYGDWNAPFPEWSAGSALS